MSRAAAADPLVTVKMPLATVTRLFVELRLALTITLSARTAPPLVRSSRLNALAWPMVRVLLLFQAEPAPFTVTALLLALWLKPSRAKVSVTRPPLVMSSVLNTLLLPITKLPLLFQADPAPLTVTVLLLALGR